MTARNLARRREVLEVIGERSVHYAKVAEALRLDPGCAHQLMRTMEAEKLLVRVGTGKWKASGRPVVEADVPARAIRADWPEKPELARVW